MTLLINPDNQTRFAFADKECADWALSNNTVHIVKDFHFFNSFLPHKSTIVDHNGKSYKVMGVGMVRLNVVLPFEEDLPDNCSEVDLIDAIWVPDAPSNIIGAGQPSFKFTYELRSCRLSADPKELPLTLLYVRRTSSLDPYIFLGCFYCHPGAAKGCLKVLRTSRSQERVLLPAWDFAARTWTLVRPEYGGFAPFIWPMEEIIKVERVKADYGIDRVRNEVKWSEVADMQPVPTPLVARVQQPAPVGSMAHATESSSSEEGPDTPSSAA